MFKNTLERLFQFVLEAFIFFSYLLPVTFFAYCAVSYFLYYLLPDININFIEKNLIMLDNKDLSMYLGSSLLFSLIGSALRRAKNKTGFSFIPPRDKEEFVPYIVTSFFFALFFSRNLFHLSKFEWIPVTLLTLLFFLLLPTLINFYSSFDFSYFRTFIIKEGDFIFHERRRKLSFSDVKVLFIIFLKFFLVIICLGSISVFTIFKIHQYAKYQKVLKEKIWITEIKPKITTLAESVTIKGYNLYCQKEQGYTIMSGFGPISDVKSCNTGEVVFVVPLNWKEGTVEVWIRKENNEKNEVQESNKVSIKVLSRWGFYPKAEEYKRKDYLLIRLFKRIKYWLLIQKD